MKGEKARMEFKLTASDYISRGKDAGLDAWDLAILAAWPDLRDAKAEDAIKYLEASREALQRIELEKLRRQYALLKLENRVLTELTKPMGYKDGMRFITAIPVSRHPYWLNANAPARQQRLERAEDWFKPFLTAKHNAKAVRHLLAKYGKNGFAEGEAYKLRVEFLAWKYPPKTTKGRQGRVRSMYDQRFLSAPPKPLKLTAKDKRSIHAAAKKRGWEEKLPGNFASRKPIRRPEEERGWTASD
jgi:hypothetical protein